MAFLVAYPRRLPRRRQRNRPHNHEVLSASADVGIFTVRQGDA